MLTENERKVLRMLLMSLGEAYSINQIAKKCSLAPNGALKILRKFEKEGILSSKRIANIQAYSISFNNEKTKNILELVLIPELSGRVKFRYEDLKPLKEVASACILFGSYAGLKKEPNDLDVFFLLESKDFKKYKEESSQIYKTVPIKVQDVLQTEEDFKKNIKSRDPVILEILKTGVILWGVKEILNLVQNEYAGQA